MNFKLDAHPERIRSSVLQLCKDFADNCWLKRDRDERFGEEFYAAMPKSGSPGIAMPGAYGGAGLGIAEAANPMMLKAARLYDSDESCGAEANAAKYFTGEAGFRACETTIMTRGGMGYAKDFQMERHLREVLIPPIAPVSP